jgi:thymidine phosphorylase
MVGNALEVRECVEVLRGGGPADLVDLSVELAALMLWLGKGRASMPEARDAVRGALADGSGLAMFRRIVERQGGDVGMVDDPATLPQAPVRADVLALRAGYVARYDAGMVGRAAVQLGAGRAKAEDVVDPGVGFELLAIPGDRVDAGMPIIRIHANSAADAELAREAVGAAIAISDTPPPPRPLILDRLGLARE